MQDALDKLMVGRTTLVVAHRLSTIRNANLICVMSEGRMVEQGSHQELLKNPNGAYSQLVALQQSPATEGGNTLSQSASGKKANKVGYQHAAVFSPFHPDSTIDLSLSCCASILLLLT